MEKQENWSAEQLDGIAKEFSRSSAEEVLRWMATQFHPKLYVACSFQKEASVIMDMLLKIEPEARFFTIDTDLLFPETHQTWRGLEEHYGINVESYKPISLEEQAAMCGSRLWERDPDKCCSIRKVEPLTRALSSVDGWISGLRREQSAARADTEKIQWDKRFGLVKANPLADWAEKDVWEYIFINDIPYNPLHDRDYLSIGCTHCTDPVVDDSDSRSGRWAESDKTECGIHESAPN